MTRAEPRWTVPRLPVAGGHLGDGSGSRAQAQAWSLGALPAPKLTTATWDKPSACPQALGQAGAAGPAGNGIEHGGAGLPTLPTGTGDDVEI